jgi:hypothetical protein
MLSWAMVELKRGVMRCSLRVWLRVTRLLSPSWWRAQMTPEERKLFAEKSLRRRGRRGKRHDDAM